ncbi:MAG TPA: tetratricopeptide repeat protein [Dehalococcoidia bacterium]|nr:tetratricopeptide repeat protein [Dehalococcoidia bacterium]
MAVQTRARRRTQAARRPPPAGRRIALGPAFALLVAALAVLVYLNALHNPFVYDDHDTVLGNRSLVDLSNVRFIFLYSLYRPVVNVSYALDRAIWGFAPFGFHLTSVLLHALVVLLFYAWCVRALRDTAPGGDATGAEWPAFIAASLYAVHPMMTEAVGYVSGRSEVLCAAGMLASLLCARRAILRGDRGAGIAAGVFGLLAAASKETAAALPVVLIAYDAWALSPRVGGFRRRMWRVYGPTGALSIVAASVRLHTLLSAEAQPGRGPFENLMTQAIVVWRYLSLLVWPAGQTVMHVVRFVTQPSDAPALIAAAGLLVIVAAAFWAHARAPLAAIGTVWFFAALAPSSSIVPLREGMAEHRVYVAMGGVLLVAAAALRALSASPHRARRVRTVGAAVVIVLALLTVRRNVVWGSAVGLWAEAASHAPGMWEPHYALADALREAGACARAIPEYEIVLRLRPSHEAARLNEGICLAQTGRAAEAEAAFRRALALDPQAVRAYTNLGALAIVEGHPEQARDAYLQAVRVDPGNVLARMQLASLYEQVFHDYHAAARMCGEARAIAPFTPGVAECAERNRRLAAEHDAGR